MKRLTFILVLGLLISVVPGIASGFNVTPVNVSSNYIKWTWDTSPITGLNVDGKLISSYDPNGTSYILSNIGAEEIHEIIVYAGADTASNTTESLPEDTGDVPLGLWIYVIPGALFLLIARYARVAVINVMAIIFGLFGLYNLISVKEVMDANLWMMSLLVYFILIFVGFINWAYMSGRVFK